MTSTRLRTGRPWQSSLFRPWTVAVLFLGWYLWHIPQQWQLDSKQLYAGCHALLSWLDGLTKTPIHPRPYPLFQYLTGLAALLAVRHGIPVNIYILWCVCSLLSLAGLCVLFHRISVSLHRPALGWACIILMLSGPLLAYANCSFNELVAACLIACFTSAVMGDSRLWLCVVLFLFSGITKEFAFVLLSVIWLGALWIDRSKNRTWHLIALAISVLACAAMNAAFNFLRYRSIWNIEYLGSQNLVRVMRWRLNYCAALWFSPNGGIIAFWPTLMITMFAVILIALRNGKRIAPTATAAVLLAGLTYGLSGWYQPFGFYSWGPRLMYPWIPASLIIILRGYPEAFASFIDACVRSKTAVVITAALLCVATLPHIMAAAEPQVIGVFFNADAVYPDDISPFNQPVEYAQNEYYAWEKRPLMLLLGLPTLQSSPRLDGILFFCAAMLVLLQECRRCDLATYSAGYSSGRSESPPNRD